MRASTRSRITPALSERSYSRGLLVVGWLQLLIWLAHLLYIPDPEAGILSPVNLAVWGALTCCWGWFLFVCTVLSPSTKVSEDDALATVSGFAFLCGLLLVMPAFIMRGSNPIEILFSVLILPAAWLAYVFAPITILILCYRGTFGQSDQPLKAWYIVNASPRDYRVGLIVSGLVQLCPWLILVFMLITGGWSDFPSDETAFHYLTTSVGMGCWLWILVSSVSLGRQTGHKVHLGLLVASALALVISLGSCLGHLTYSADQLQYQSVPDGGWAIALYIIAPVVYAFSLVELYSKHRLRHVI